MTTLRANSRYSLLTLLFAVVLCGLSSSALAEKRGVRIDGKEAAQYVAERTGKSWAVVIGINEYEKVRRLTYAKADAESVATVLRQRGFQVSTLYDKQATRGGILRELGDRLVDRVGENDRVLIYFAGHGETKQPKGGKEIGYLLPVGGEQDSLAETAIPMSMIRDLADALPAKQVLFVVDVCYGGIAGQQFRSSPKYTEEYLKAITRERGRQLITAGGPKQEAMEGPEWGHSVFTYYLLEGLNKGTADLNSDGIIPTSELYAYLDERVFSAAQMKGHAQRPVMWTMAAERGEFVFFTSANAKGKEIATNRTNSPDALETERQRLQEEREKLIADERAKLEAERKQFQEERERRLAEEKRQAEERAMQVAKAPAYEAPQTIGAKIPGIWYVDFPGYSRQKYDVSVSGQTLTMTITEYYPYDSRRWVSASGSSWSMMNVSGTLDNLRFSGSYRNDHVTGEVSANGERITLYWRNQTLVFKRNP